MHREGTAVKMSLQALDAVEPRRDPDAVAVDGSRLAQAFKTGAFADR
jgi:hypothetical protein